MICLSPASLNLLKEQLDVIGIAEYFEENNLFEIPVSLEKRYEILGKIFEPST